MKRLGMSALVLALAWGTVGCGSTPGTGGKSRPDTGVGPEVDNDVTTPGPDAVGGVEVGATKPDAAGVVDNSAVTVRLVPPTDAKAALLQTRSQASAGAPASADAFLETWKPTYNTALGYDPLQAVNVATLQASVSKLNTVELAKLGANGFVVSGRQKFPTFFAGYESIYADHLPLFISADSVLYAVHKSYDGILMYAENMLIPQVGQLLGRMHGALTTAGDPRLDVARKDVDLFLTVARRLLQPAGGAMSVAIAPVAGASAAEAETLVAKAKAQITNLNEMTSLFGTERVVDWSQFTPRGHYAGSATFEAYFRSMIWLERMDLRIIFSDLAGAQRFSRRQFDAALMMRLLLDDAGLVSWQGVDDVLSGFVGESDNMTVRDFDRLRTTLGDATLLDLESHSDGELAQAIVDAKLGIQRVASQVLLTSPGGNDFPLDRSFAFFGQRYVVDSEVLSNVVFDRVLPDPIRRDPRMMPDPLDVAFAALGNTHAAPLLKGDLAAHTNYPRALHAARLLVDAHEPSFWSGSLYQAWLGSLRAMSPAPDLAAATGVRPAVARSEPWARRVLNAQLASWAELRHDTLLYAKQSYSSVPLCEFPDAYVDPYPELWAALGRYAAKGQQILLTLPFNGQSTAANHFAELSIVANRLEDMARRQLAGQAFTADQLAWVNTTVETKDVSVVCTTVRRPSGWYVRLFLDPEKAAEYDPTIADVHTDPDSGRVLHVATSGPRLMVMTAETCVGPRAYVGLTSSYHQTVTDGFKRLQDGEWTQKITSAAPADVSWMADLVVP